MSGPRPIMDIFETRARAGDGRFAIAYALLELAEAQRSCATWLKYLGNGDAATSMGALEALGVHVGEQLNRVATAISEVRDDEG